MKVWARVTLGVAVIAVIGAGVVAPVAPAWIQTNAAHSELISLEGFQRADFSVNVISRGLPTVVVKFDGAIAAGTSQARQKELVHALLASIDRHGLRTMDSPVLHLPNGTRLTLDMSLDGNGSAADIDSALGIVLSANALQADLATSEQVQLSLADRLPTEQCRDPQVVPARFAELESRIHRTESVSVRTSVSGVYVHDCPDIDSARTLSDAELAAIAALPQWHRDNQARVITYSAQFETQRALVVTVTAPQMDATVPETLIASLAEAGMPVKLKSQWQPVSSNVYQYVLVASS